MDYFEPIHSQANITCVFMKKNKSVSIFGIFFLVNQPTF
jgi:hypothetical protein